MLISYVNIIMSTDNHFKAYSLSFSILVQYIELKYCVGTPNIEVQDLFYII